MKKLLEFLTDPYLHVSAIVLVLLGLALAGGGSTPALAMFDPEHCDLCNSSHSDDYQCLIVLDKGPAQLGAVR